MSDLLDYMNRRQLETIAKEERVQSWRYSTKFRLIAALRRKRSSK